jgi:hypothetical protein
MGMELIQHYVVPSGGVVSINFSPIAANWTNLLVLTSIRGTDAAGSANVEMRFNTSNSGYATRLLYGTGSNASSSTGGSDRIQWASNVPASGGTANTFGNGEIYIPNYLSSSAKSVSITTVSEGNFSVSRQDVNASSWSGTAPITSIQLFMEIGNLAEFSSATLYGII